MKANDYFWGVNEDGIETDELAELISDGKMDAVIEDFDSHWTEVMRLAERYGFISQAYGGAAIVTTNHAYLEANGPQELARRLRMQNVEIG
jgi:hypothetical protein